MGSSPVVVVDRGLLCRGEKQCVIGIVVRSVASIDKWLLYSVHCRQVAALYSDHYR